MDHYTVKQMTRIIFLLFLIGFASCKSIKRESNQEILVRDSVIVVERAVPVLVPGAEIRTQPLNIDSLAALLRAGVPPSVINRTTVVEDPDTKLRIGILIDELGNLTALCEQQDRIIEGLEREINRYRTEINTLKESTVKQNSKFWMYLSISLLILWVITILLSVRRIF